MGLGKDTLNGIISLVISVAVTKYTVNPEDGPWELDEILLAVAVSAFLSGFFTSYFAE
jgi:hypothetical protein